MNGCIVKELDRPVVEAAILIPVFRGNSGELRLVLVRRSEGGRKPLLIGGRCRLLQTKIRRNATGGQKQC